MGRSFILLTLALSAIAASATTPNQSDPRTLADRAASTYLGR